MREIKELVEVLDIFHDLCVDEWGSGSKEYKDFNSKLTEIKGIVEQQAQPDEELEDITVYELYDNDDHWSEEMYAEKEDAEKECSRFQGIKEHVVIGSGKKIRSLLQEEK